MHPHPSKPHPASATGFRLVRVADVKVPPGRRPPRKARELAESIEDVGLLNPITLTDDLRLIAGGNRLAAHKLLKREWIEARILTLDQVRAEVAAIEDNLRRDEGTALERARLVARHRELY